MMTNCKHSHYKPSLSLCSLAINCSHTIVNIANNCYQYYALKKNKKPIIKTNHN